MKTTPNEQQLRELDACHNCWEPVKRRGNLFCSWKCYVAHKWVDRVCSHCRRPFKARKIYVARGQMKFCSTVCSQLNSRAATTIEYGGDSYHISNGYYVCSLTGKRLHHVIWEAVFGPIPKGFVVHHKDSNKINNCISNLELMEWGEHTRHHHSGRQRLKQPKKYCHCGRESRARGLCTMHYQRDRKAFA